MIKTTKLLRTASLTGAAILVMFTSASSALAATPTFSQTNYTIGVGQTATITSQNGVAVYMTLNSLPTVVSVSTNGTNVTLKGIGLGNSSLTFCAVGTATDCMSMGVTVQAGVTSSISLNPNNVSLPVGNSQAVALSGGNGSYAVASNSNTSVVSTSLSANTLTVSGLSAGSATINICDTVNTCGSLSATITSTSTSASASALSFSSNNLSLTAGSNQIITVSGGNGSYKVSSNSNSNVATTSISGNVSNSIIVSASSTGSAAINVCDTSNACGTISVTVTAPGSNQVVTFNVPNPTVAVGQNLNVSLSNSVGASGYIILTNVSPNIAQAAVNGSTLSLSGLSAGTDLFVICATGGGCSQLNVTVIGSAASTASAPVATTSVISAPVTAAPAQTPVVTAPTGTGTVAVSAQVLAQIQTIKTSLAQALAQIQLIQSQLAQLEAQLKAGGISDVSVSAGANLSSGPFTELLTLGSQSSQVAALQKKLSALGFYSGPITGYYGSLTRQAVMDYQTARNITPTGSLSTGTRTALNAEN